jgi:hypothetical protein
MIHKIDLLFTWVLEKSQTELFMVLQVCSNMILIPMDPEGAV